MQDGKELRKQDVVIGDETGSCRLGLWEDDVSSLEEGKLYRLVDMGVHRYGATKYLSFTAKSSKEMIADLENVNEEHIAGEESEDSRHVVKGEVSAVLSTSEYPSCKFCHSKVVSEDGLFGECSKCSAVMKMAYCEETKSAKFVVWHLLHDSMLPHRFRQTPRNQANRCWGDPLTSHLQGCPPRNM